MSELEHVEIKGTKPEEPEGRPPEEDGRRVVWPLVVAVVVLLAAIAAYFLWFREISEQRPKAADTAPAAEEPAPAAPRPAAERETPELPPLGESDALVRRMVEAATSHPEISQWLVTDELVRKFTAAVDNVAQGQSPRPHLKTLAPEREFEAEAEGGEVVVDPASYDRYDTVAAAIDSVDAAGIVRLLERVRPLVDEAYRQLGYPNRDFEATLAEAIDHLLATPIPEGPVELEPAVESFRYADPELEGLSEAQKHLLRMGPENARVVVAKLREVRAALAAPPG